MGTVPGFEHPSLSLPVSDLERQRAESALMDAYADSRLSEEEFERRIGLAIAATNRRELNEAFFGLVEPPPAPQSLSRTASYGSAPVTRHDGDAVDGAGRATAAVAHFLPLVSSALGPGLIFAISQPGSFARRESAKAFNFQLIALVSLIVAGMSSWILPDALVGLLFSVAFLGWLIGTITGGAKAASGEDWTNPIRRAIPWQVLPEGKPTPKRLER